MKKIRGLLVCGLAWVTVFAMVVLVSPGARAYGNEVQWQIGLSGTFHFVPVGGGVSGFWGWCVFGGSDGSASVGTTGTTGDCVIANYFGLGPGVPAKTITIDIDATGWVLEPTTAFAIPGISPYFFLTSGTVVLAGSGAADIYSQFGLPPRSPIPLSSTTGPSACGPDPTAALGSLCDTGIPAVPDHFSFHAPGIVIEIQVTKVR